MVLRIGHASIYAMMIDGSNVFSTPGQPGRLSIRPTNMPNRILLFAAAILMQARGVPPPLPGTPAPANAVPQVIFTAPGNFVVPPGADQPGQLLPPGTATLEGIVTIPGTSDPIAGAAVEMRKTDCGKTGGESMSTTSGPDGKFSFKQVRAGSWCIGVAKSGGTFSPVKYQQRGY